jgi:hypothetical protein
MSLAQEAAQVSATISISLSRFKLDTFYRLYFYLSFNDSWDIISSYA